MAKKKKQGKSAHGNPDGKTKAFNAPFAGLRKELKQAHLRQEKEPKPQPKPAENPIDEAAEAASFAKAMSGVRRLGDQDSRHASREPAKPPAIQIPPDDDLEVMAHLADLVAGAAEFDMHYSRRYMQGRLPGVADDLMDRMRRGDFPIQDHIDLHGLDLHQAEAEVQEFIVRSVTRGMRHVLIVHGKGLSSPGGTPVIRPEIPTWLGRKRMRKYVLAFCTALVRDGGEGAVYVLLRKWAGPGQGRTFI